jgi:hypothetical protein
MRKHSHKDADYRRVEVITGQKRRRDWTTEEKAEILAATMASGATVTTRDAIDDGTTDECAALTATAAHHNALSATLSETPERFAPLFARDAKGAVDIGPWCRGFHAAIQLNPKFWRKLLPARGRAHLWLIPILAHCVDAEGRPVRGAPPPGPLTELAHFNADREIPGAVAAIRAFWKPARYTRISRMKVEFLVQPSRICYQYQQVNGFSGANSWNT